MPSKITLNFYLSGLLYKGGPKKLKVKLPAKYLSKMAQNFTTGFFLPNDTINAPPQLKLKKMRKKYPLIISPIPVG